jgi:hypothetical protein
MTFMADKDSFIMLVGRFGRLVMDFGDQGTGRIDGGQTAFLGRFKNGGRDTVRAKNNPLTGLDFVEVLDKNNPAPAEIIDHIRIVDDLMVDIEGGSVFGQGQFHDINGEGDSGTETLRFR